MVDASVIGGRQVANTTATETKPYAVSGVATPASTAPSTATMPVGVEDDWLSSAVNDRGTNVTWFLNWDAATAAATTTPSPPQNTAPPQTSPSCFANSDGVLFDGSPAASPASWCVCDVDKFYPTMTATSAPCAYATLPASQITIKELVPTVTTSITSCRYVTETFAASASDAVTGVFTTCTCNDDNGYPATIVSSGGSLVQTCLTGSFSAPASTPTTTTRPPPTSPMSAAVTVQAGSAPVHVGTLTGSALYTSISSALEHLCPSVTQTTSMTACETGSVTIGDIDFSDDGTLGQGELVVVVDSSAYNVSSLRDAMIHAAALTAQNSAVGNNCYEMEYTVEELRKRGADNTTSLEVRDHPHPVEEKMTVCNVAQFAGVQYFNPYWRLAPQPGASDFIDASWSFQVGPGGDFLCDFLADLTDALLVIEPEFAVEDVELGEEIQAVCQQAVDIVNS
ncbi:MAG: hypothetical protein M1838_004935 [Thelocarpon superellum]|nr:MAG: hypothetical protein M1838_004935 [Thelocarpon superellum]